MTKFKKNLIITAIILFQTTMAIAAGLFVLYVSKKDYIPPNVFIEPVDSICIGNQTRDQALNIIKEYYKPLIENSRLTIKWDKSTYNIKFNDIDASIDYMATLDLAFKKKEKGRLLGFIRDYFAEEKRIIYPVIEYNEEKLRGKVIELSSMVNKPHEDARMFLENGSIVKVPEKSGVRLNTENTIKKIEGGFGKHLREPVELKFGYHGEIYADKPDVTLEKLKSMDTIIASFSIKIKYPEVEEYIKRAAPAINSVKLEGRGMEEFSFNECLKERGMDPNQVYDEYNQVASALYAALLKTEISLDAIKRSKNETPVDYTMPGLDVKIDNINCDFKFRNTLSHSIIIFTEVKDKDLTVYIVGSKRDVQGESNIKVMEVQKFEPSTYSVVNYDLKPGEKNFISYGKPGTQVEVYKVKKKNGREEEELLYTNKYEAVAAILQIGPPKISDNKIIK
ncbi:MAG: peptidoglycan binding domain-containing protein [Bacillota bacterium]